MRIADGIEIVLETDINRARIEAHAMEIMETRQKNAPQKAPLPQENARYRDPRGCNKRYVLMRRGTNRAE